MSKVLLRTLAPFDQATPTGTLTGAWLLAQVDAAAGLAGAQFTGGAALMIAIKDLTFRAALQAGEVFQITGTETRRGRTSFGVAITATGGDGRVILDADLALLAVDETGQPRAL